MQGMYGARFLDAWRGVDIDDMHAVWGNKLAKYTAAEVTTGIHACETLKWPPTLPEFLALCRPPMEPERAFYEAVEQMARRATGDDEWSRPVIFHAAARIGGDLKTLPYIALKYRWEAALKAAQRDLDAGRVGEVPPRVVGPLLLANDPKSTPMPQEVRDQLAAMLARMKSRSKSFGDNNAS